MSRPRHTPTPRVHTWAARFAILATVSLAVLIAGSRGAEPAHGQGQQFASLDAAVAAGRLDAQVRDALRAEGEAEAIIVLAEAAVRTQVEQARANRGQTRDDPRAIEEKQRAFTTLKQQALAIAGTTATVVQDYDHFGVQHLRLRSEAALLAMLNSSRVQAVRENHIQRVSLTQSLALINQPAAKNAGYTGAGASIAIIDTGVDYTRAAFGNCTAPNVPANTCRVPFAQDFTRNLDGSPMDDGQRDALGHGTNVAGIAAGVAPNAKILSLDVFRPEGWAYDSEIILALDWVLANRLTYNIASANLSLGNGLHWQTQCGGSAYDSPFANLRAAGVLPVVAAGNSAHEGYGFENGLGGPACAPGAVSVGAVYDDTFGPVSWGQCDDENAVADGVICFSQSASYLTLLAPGAFIDAAGLYGYAGTSMAAPHVAGAVAVLHQACASAAANQLETALTSAGPRITDTRNAGQPVTKRRLDVMGAVQALGPCASTSPTTTPTATASPCLRTWCPGQAPTPTTTATATATASPPPCLRSWCPGTNPTATATASATATSTSTATVTPTAPPCLRSWCPGQTPTVTATATVTSTSTATPTATATSTPPCLRVWCP